MEPLNVDHNGLKNALNTVVIRPGKLDRSPCGTGTSARLALLRKKNEIDIGEKIVAKSIIGSTFEAFIESETNELSRVMIKPNIKGSAFITGIVAMGFAPSMLIMSLFGGVAGDRLERRLVIQISQVASAVLALVIAVLIAVDAIHWVHLFFASLLQGMTFAFQMPARQAILPRLVGKENITNAVALNSAGMGVMTIIAPGIAGVLYGFAGPESVYFAVAGISALAVVLTSRLPRFLPELNSAKKNVFEDISEGLKYTWNNRLVFVLLISGLTSALLIGGATISLITGQPAA